MKKLLLTILIFVLYFSSNAQSPLRINKYLIDSLSSGIWRIYHDSLHNGSWRVLGSGGGGGGSGTVTSVSFTGGLISVATATTTPALTVAGTSGGIPYFSSTSTWATSGLLTANAIMIGGGAGTAPSTTTTGTGVLTALGINVGSAGALITFNGAAGTPSSITLSNGTGLPISTGVSGLGTGVATALAVNTGTAGSFVVNGGALGTPSSGTLTNATGYLGANLVLTDVTTNDVSTSAHGFFPKLTSNTMYYVNNSGALVALPFGTSGKVLTTNGTTSAPTWETPSGGAGAWNAITDPTGDLALTFQAGEATVMTDQNTTEDHWTVNNATATTNSLYSLNRTSTALASGNNIMELISSGANGTASITSTGLVVSNTNTGTTNTNVGIDVTASGGSTTNIGMFIKNVASSQKGIVISSGTTETSAMWVGYDNSTTNWGVYALNSTILELGTGGGNVVVNPGFSTMATFSSAAFTSSSNIRITNGGRTLLKQGADVASAAGAIALGADGNSFEITGTNAITLISSTNWQNGSIVTLVFTSTATLTDGTANSGTDIGMELAGNANFVASAGATLTMVLSEIGGTQRWREVARSVQ